jgi:hypothetical protein
MSAPKKEFGTPGVLGGKRKITTPSSPRNVRPVALEFRQSEEESPSPVDVRLLMHHLMQYEDPDTGRGHTILIFQLFPGTEITEEISKDGT